MGLPLLHLVLFYASERDLMEHMEEYVSLRQFNHLPETLFNDENLLIDNYTLDTKIFGETSIHSNR